MGEHLNDGVFEPQNAKDAHRAPGARHHRAKNREEVFRKMIAISHEVSGLEASMNGAAPVTPLSSQELEILRMFAAGNDAPRIAKGLGISPQTLRNHLHHVNKKLRTHNRLEAVTHALQRRLI